MKRALISVSDKTGVVELAKFLHSKGIEIISTGGTMKVIKEAGIPVQYVSDITGFPEIMDGRVKTLNPYIHGGILAVRNNPEHQAAMKANNIHSIDMVVVNLYPFLATISKDNVTEEEAIENIDIGGPAMIRAAAKNFNDVVVVVNPRDYDTVKKCLSDGQEVPLTVRRKLAEEAFRHTSEYDGFICSYLTREITPEETFLDNDIIFLEKVSDLRYGENPHQKATFYRVKTENAGIANVEQLHGKELSFNNIVDVEAAYRIVSEIESPAVAIIKHTNPCGAAIAATLAEAYAKAFAADEVSAFGGIVSLNRIVDLETARQISTLFVEAVIAPDYESAALALLQKKKNIRLLKLPLLEVNNNFDIKRVSGGLLVQDNDNARLLRKDMQVVTKREPTEAEWSELEFAWQVVKHVKSNAILLTKNLQTVGVGAGQMNRVGSAKIALEQAGEKAKGAVMSSDAFFPFRDTIDEAKKYGITAIVQPGGSVRDEESIQAANEAGIAMVFTGVRHFKH